MMSILTDPSDDDTSDGDGGGVGMEMAMTMGRRSPARMRVSTEYGKKRTVKFFRVVVKSLKYVNVYIHKRIHCS